MNIYALVHIKKSFAKCFSSNLTTIYYKDVNSSFRLLFKQKPNLLHKIQNFINMSGNILIYVSLCISGDKNC